MCKIRGLVLDATFDHVLPLAELRMPAFMQGLVRATVSSHFDLCNARLTASYRGPITVVRRRDDDIIATTSVSETSEIYQPAQFISSILIKLGLVLNKNTGILL